VTRTAKENERERERERERRSEKENEKSERARGAQRVRHDPQLDSTLSFSLSVSLSLPSLLASCRPRRGSAFRAALGPLFALETLDILIPTDRPSLSSLFASERQRKRVSFLSHTLFGTTSTRLSGIGFWARYERRGCSRTVRRSKVDGCTLANFTQDLE